MAQNGYFSSYSPQLTATNYTVTSTSNQTLTTSGVVIATVTPVAGTYLVVASCSLTASSAAGNVATVGILYNGTYQTGSLHTATPQSTNTSFVYTNNFQAMTIATNCILTVDGSIAVTLAGYTSAGTVTVNPLVMNLVRIS